MGSDFGTMVCPSSCTLFHAPCLIPGMHAALCVQLTVGLREQLSELDSLLDRMTVAQLQECASWAGVTKGGKKAEILARLRLRYRVRALC
jgi:hypothetical protein